MNGTSAPRVHVLVKTSEAIIDDTNRPASFEDFFVTQRERLFRALFLLTRDREDARDIAQDAFVAVWERWDRVSRLDDPAAYLFRTALNKYRSRIRRARVAARWAFGWPKASNDVDHADERADVARALAALSSRQREAIVLTEFLQYDSVEAGRIMGVTGATVRRLSQNARERLKKTLEVEDA